MGNLINALKAMADEQRMNILVVLTLRGAVCVSHLQEAMRAPQPTVSRYLSILRSAGLLEAERRGQWVHYKLIEDEGEIAVQMIRKCAEELKDTAKIRRIMERLDKLEQQPALPEEGEAKAGTIKKNSHSVRARAKSRRRATMGTEDAPPSNELSPSEINASNISGADSAVLAEEAQIADITSQSSAESVKEPPQVETIEKTVEQHPKKNKRVKKEQPPSLFDF